MAWFVRGKERKKISEKKTYKRKEKKNIRSERVRERKIKLWRKKNIHVNRRCRGKGGKRKEEREKRTSIRMICM